MASNTRVVEAIRKAKKTASGQRRKREIAQQHRDASEKKLEAALGEKITLSTVR